MPTMNRVSPPRAAAAVSRSDGSAPEAPSRRWTGVLRRGAIVVVACCLLAVVLWLSDRRINVSANFIYSLSIGISCWVMLDGGRSLAWAVLQRLRRGRGSAGNGSAGLRSLAWAVVVLLLPLGTWVGYVIGATIGDAFTGHRLPKPGLDGSSDFGGSLVISLLMAVGISAILFARERLAMSRAQIAAAERLAAESRLALLQSQLEPHMLFNTLANLRVLIGLDATRAQEMLDRLIAFLRATLAASRSSAHPLAAEFDRLADYLALIGVRMGARLQVRLDLPEDLRTLLVPPLLLQPLVENAVQHGLEPKVAGGRIEVTARRDGPRLRLSVRDTGLGLDAAVPSSGTHFGLQQVRERLAALHGDAASLLLQAAEDAEGGTLAVVTLPLGPSP